MASGEITGASARDLSALRSEFRDTPVHRSGVAFSTAYCISEIGKQPDDYDGPQRYCRNRAAKVEDEDGVEQYAPCCRFHGGRSHNPDTADNLEVCANLQHGYYAMEEHLLADLSEPERDAYNEIMSRGEEEGITREDDFWSWETLQSLALNIVTDRRLRVIINEEGVTRTVRIFQEGALVDEQEEEHHLLGTSLTQRRLIESLKDNLGLTRKHRDEMDAVEAGGAITFLSEGMSDAVDSGTEYDPEDWEDGDG